MLFTGDDPSVDLGDLGGLETDTEGDGGPREVAQIMEVVGSTFVFLCLLVCLLVFLAKGKKTKD